MRKSRPIAILLAVLATMLPARQSGLQAAAAPLPPAAGAPVCGGRDLIAAMQQSEPERYRTVVAAEQASRNSAALLWKIEKDGLAPSFLLGTMHMSDARLTTLPAAAAEALGASRKVALELGEIIDERQFTAATMSNITKIAFIDGRSIETLLSAAEIEQLKLALAKFGMPYPAMRIMKPWFLSLSLALPRCEIERKKAGLEALDVTIGRKAQQLGVPLVGLETVDEQFAAFDSLSLDDQKRLLLSSVKLLPLLEDQIETMTRLYVERRIGALWELTRQLTIKYAEPGEEAADLATLDRFKEVLVTRRNQTMAERALPLIAEGGAFIAVGAMHLPDEGGLVDRLQQAGYKVTAVD
jgi:uncharacterized protein YbaP (TraB family)